MNSSDFETIPRHVSKTRHVDISPVRPAQVRITQATHKKVRTTNACYFVPLNLGCLIIQTKLTYTEGLHLRDLYEPCMEVVSITSLTPSQWPPLTVRGM
jgi:hypothetical protein